MAETQSITDFDLRIRHFIYRFFADQARPPTVRETATAAKLGEPEVQSSYQRLHSAHFIFLNPGTDSIRMANPLSAIPTPYVTWLNGKSYWANCAWDMLGIVAMLPGRAIIRATYHDTNESAEITIRDGQPRHQGGVIHFPLPVRRWYDDLIQT